MEKLTPEKDKFISFLVESISLADRMASLVHGKRITALMGGTGAGKTTTARFRPKLHHERGLEIDVSGSDGDSVADIGTQYQGKSGEHAGSITISCQSHYGSDLHTR